MRVKDYSWRCTCGNVMTTRQPLPVCLYWLVQEHYNPGPYHLHQTYFDDALYHLGQDTRAHVGNMEMAALISAAQRRDRLAQLDAVIDARQP